MGLEAATVGLIASAVGAASAVYGTVEAGKASKKASEEQKEAKEISEAAQKNQEAEQRRQAIREQRIRTAQIEQGAVNAGASGSSGEIGAVSGAKTVTASNIAFGESTALAAQGISSRNQAAAEASLNAQINQGIAGIGFSAINLGMNMGAGQALFGEDTKNQVSRQLDNTINANPSLF